MNKNPNVSDSITLHKAYGVDEVVGNIRQYAGQENKHIHELAKNGDEEDKRVAREVNRVLDNIDRICRIAECAKK